MGYKSLGLGYGIQMLVKDRETLMQTRRWTYEIERDATPPTAPRRWWLLASEMKFGESHVVDSRIDATSFANAIRTQKNASPKSARLKDDTGRIRVWKLEKKPKKENADK